MAILIPLLLVGLVWGVTNVLMKRGSAGITELPAKRSRIEGTIQEMIFLLTRPLYVISFLGNMSGSVLFYYTLSHSDVSLVGPIANAVTFIVTSATGRVLEKEHLGIGSILGMVAVIVGVGICVNSKA
jgi:drug/metabolite transporter (DMT)-like permease